MSIAKILPAKEKLLLHHRIEVWPFGCGAFMINDSLVNRVDSLPIDTVEQYLKHTFFGRSVPQTTYDIQEWFIENVNTAILLEQSSEFGGFVTLMNAVAFFNELAVRNLITKDIQRDDFLRLIYFITLTHFFYNSRKKPLSQVRLSARYEIEGLQSEHLGIIANVGFTSEAGKYKYLIKFAGIDELHDLLYHQIKKEH